MKLGVSRRSNAMVPFARCAGALSCWKMKKSLYILQIAGNIFSINRTFLSFHPSFETATETISERMKVRQVCSGRLASTLRFSVIGDIPTLLRGLFYQPTTTVTLQQYYILNENFIFSAENHFNSKLLISV